MFPKNSINLIYRILCLISYTAVIFFVHSLKTVILLFVVYVFLALCEKSFRNIELIIVTILILGICYLLNNYWLFKIILFINYVLYYLDTSYYTFEKKEKISEKEYIRFKNTNKKKKGLNNITAIYITVHLVILFIAILVG